MKDATARVPVPEAGTAMEPVVRMVATDVPLITIVYTSPYPEEAESLTRRGVILPARKAISLRHHRNMIPRAMPLLLKEMLCWSRARIVGRP